MRTTNYLFLILAIIIFSCAGTKCKTSENTLSFTEDKFRSKKDKIYSCKVASLPSNLFYVTFSRKLSDFVFFYIADYQ